MTLEERQLQLAESSSADRDGGSEVGVLWVDLTPAEAAQLRDALNGWDGEPHSEAEWHAHVFDEDRLLTLTIGNDPRNSRDPS